jgi:hypothetical protein
MLILTFAAVLSFPPARAQTQVDLALVLAVDVSYSMDPDEQALQREGYVEAFRSPLVHRAIHDGVLGRIAVTYMDWSGPADQRIVLPWTLIEAAEDAMAFADQLASSPPRRAALTSISGAIDRSVNLLASGPFATPARRVIDISGDGANNRGRHVSDARDNAVGRGIVINGLPIMLKAATSPWDIPNLDEYYRDCVIGGEGAFMMAVREREQFVEAIKAKIIREIAALPDPHSRITRVQATAQTDCRGGENGVWNRGRED